MISQSASGNKEEKLNTVNGFVRNLYQQPMPFTTVRVYSKGMRGRQLLGEAATDTSGHYTISYQPKNIEGTALVIAAYDKHKKLLKESEVLYNVPESLQQDIDLSGKPFAGAPEYEQLVNQLAPFTEELPLSGLTETAKHPDISFINQKTGLPKDMIEKLVMAARFATYSPVAADVWYGILRNNLPAQQRGAGYALHGLDFETRLQAAFEGLMHTNTDVLTSAVQKAGNDNVIAFSFIARLAEFSKHLNTQMLAFADAHPIHGAPSVLKQKAILGGLKGEELQSFIKIYINHTGTDLWKQLPKSTGFENNKKIDRLQAVFHLSRLTGDNLQLTEHLIKSQKITSAAEIKKLAGYKSNDWEALIKTQKIKHHAITRGKSRSVKASDYATQLEAAFTHEFPTAAFAARLKKDSASTLPGKEKISSFLERNENFDLLNDRIGKFMNENKKAVAEQDAGELSRHLRRIQRVMKLTPVYNNAQVLLNDNIHSARQVYKMGKDNFVSTYGNRLGKATATNVFNKASKVHATSVALVGNLRSMADASAMNAFPDYKTPMLQQLAAELPTLDTLFGTTNNFDCSECDSVYGAPAYLTDIMHFLDQRLSSLPAINGKIPSVKDILLSRRPDIGNIDLCCDNTNTEVPYIDIACEVMEDYIAPPVITIAFSTYSSLLVKGVINAKLLSAIQNQYAATGQSNIGNLLTASATVSEPYIVNHLLDSPLQAGITYLAQTHWMIRDGQVTLRASTSTNTTTIEIRLVYQTLLSSTAIDGGPEYININVYNNILKPAVITFIPPFDLFETEAELYLRKLGVAKADLIHTFRPHNNLAPGASPADINTACAYLGINEAEQNLIFVANPAYWGSDPTENSVEIDVFEKLTGLNYLQILNLIQLQFINPLKDIVIQHDNLSADITKMNITSLTLTKFDAIIRFLRLWRKTNFTMDELDAIIMCSRIGQGKITIQLAWQLQQFLLLQQKLKLSAFQLLAFYAPLDTTHNFPDCQYNQLFQNNEVTNPVSPDLSIAAVTPGTLPITEPDKAIIATVLQISIDEVNLLLAMNGNTNLTMNILSIVYRYAQLAHSMQMPVSDLVSLLALYGLQLSEVLNSPYDTNLFIQKYKLVQSAGFGMGDLEYMYNSRFKPIIIRWSHQIAR